jgi:hypothetical protein
MVISSFLLKYTPDKHPRTTPDPPGRTDEIILSGGIFAIATPQISAR